MTTLEEVVSLIERGRYDEAMERIGELEDPIDKVDAIARIVRRVPVDGNPDWIPELVDDAVYIIEHMDHPSDRVIGYSILASALLAVGYDEGAEFFDAAVDEAGAVDNPLDSAVSLAILAYYMAISGYPDHALETFNAAFDSLVNAEIEYRLKVDGLIRIGELMEQAADRLPSKDAVEFYRVAFDIFDKLNVNQRAALVEKKLELARTVYEVGLPAVRKALLEGRNHYALTLIDRRYKGTSRLIGHLEVALWMKRVNNPEYIDIAGRAFEECKSTVLTDASVQRIAALLTELGDLERALNFAMEINDLRKRSEAMKAISFELAAKKDYESAIKLAQSIPDPSIKREALVELNSLGEGR